MSRPDMSVLRPPITLGGSGVQQIVECMQIGTSEVRNALTHECDVLLECKVCRSMFRALPNFLAHKRVYCQATHQSPTLPQQFVQSRSEDCTTIVQPSSPPALPACMEDMEENVDGRGNDDSASDVSIPVMGRYDPYKATKELNTQSQGERPARSDQGHSEASKFYNKTIERIQNKEKEKRHCVVQLSPITTNQHAMMQTFHRDTSNQGKDKQVKQARKFTDIADPSCQKSMSENAQSGEPPSKKAKLEEVVLEPQCPKEYQNMSLRLNPKPNHKLKTALKHMNPVSVKDKLRIIPQCSVKNLKCLRCKTTYSAAKTLYNHMIALHSDQRTYYPCPYCKTAFTQLWGLTRHIEKAHGKTKKQIDRMRERLRRKAIQKAQIGSKDNFKPQSKPDDSLNADLDSGKPATVVAPMPKGQAFVSLSSAFATKHYQCHECGRIFTKKDALTRHLPFCMRKIPSGTMNLSPGTPPANHKAASPSDRKPSPASAPNKITTPEIKAATQKPPAATTSNQSDVFVGFSAEDVKKIQALIDEDKCVCKKCDKSYSSISYLHRHAVRHLGWRRFKCGLCRFTCYNRSECKSHLQRVHASKLARVPAASGFANYVLDLEPDEVATTEVPISRVNLQDSEAGNSKGRSKRTLAFKQNASPTKSGGSAVPEVSKNTLNVKNVEVEHTSKKFSKSTPVEQSKKSLLQTTIKEPAHSTKDSQTKSTTVEKRKGVQATDTNKPTTPQAGSSALSLKNKAPAPSPSVVEIVHRSSAQTLGDKEVDARSRSQSTDKGKAGLRGRSQSTERSMADMRGRSQSTDRSRTANLVRSRSTDRSKPGAVDRSHSTDRSRTAHLVRSRSTDRSKPGAIDRSHSHSIDRSKAALPSVRRDGSTSRRLRSKSPGRTSKDKTDSMTSGSDAESYKESSRTKNEKENKKMSAKSNPRQKDGPPGKKDDSQLQILRTRSGVKYVKPSLEEILQRSGRTLLDVGSEDEAESSEDEEHKTKEEKTKADGEKGKKVDNSKEKDTEVTQRNDKGKAKTNGVGEADKLPKQQSPNKGSKTAKGTSSTDNSKGQQKNNQAQMKSVPKDKPQSTPPRIIKSQQDKSPVKAATKSALTPDALTKPVTASDIIKRQRRRASSSIATNGKGSPQQSFAIAPKSTTIKMLPTSPPTKTFDLSKAKFILSPLSTPPPGMPNQQINLGNANALLTATGVHMKSFAGPMLTESTMASSMPSFTVSSTSSCATRVFTTITPSTSAASNAIATTANTVASPRTANVVAAGNAAGFAPIAPRPTQKDFIVLVESPTGVNKVVEAMTKAAQMGTRLSSNCMYVLKNDVLTPVSKPGPNMTKLTNTNPSVVLTANAAGLSQPVVTSAVLNSRGYATRSGSALLATSPVTSAKTATATTTTTPTAQAAKSAAGTGYQ